MRMSEPVTSRLYDLWSLCYDATFGALVHARQKRALEQFRFQPGDRVLDLGAGTGMTLPHYPHDVHVVAMDLSEGMLAKARAKCRKLGLDHCDLVLADAMRPPFAERSFDHVLISHTVSVVSDPPRLMQWAERLLRPGGRIVVLNHFRSTHPFIGWWERVLNPLFVKIGWRSDLSLEEAMTGVNLEIEYLFQMRTIDLWKIVVLSNRSPDAPAGEPAMAGRPRTASA